MNFLPNPCTLREAFSRYIDITATPSPQILNYLSTLVRWSCAHDKNNLTSQDFWGQIGTFLIYCVSLSWRSLAKLQPAYYEVFALLLGIGWRREERIRNSWKGKLSTIIMFCDWLYSTIQIECGVFHRQTFNCHTYLAGWIWIRRVEISQKQKHCRSDWGLLVSHDSRCSLAGTAASITTGKSFPYGKFTYNFTCETPISHVKIPISHVKSIIHMWKVHMWNEITCEIPISHVKS